MALRAINELPQHVGGGIRVIAAHILGVVGRLDQPPAIIEVVLVPLPGLDADAAAGVRAVHDAEALVHGNHLLDPPTQTVVLVRGDRHVGEVAVT